MSNQKVIDLLNQAIALLAEPGAVEFRPADSEQVLERNEFGAVKLARVVAYKNQLLASGDTVASVIPDWYFVQDQEEAAPSPEAKSNVFMNTSRALMLTGVLGTAVTNPIVAPASTFKKSWMGLGPLEPAETLEGTGSLPRANLDFKGYGTNDVLDCVKKYVEAQRRSTT